MGYVPERLVKNHAQYKVMRQAASLPFMQEPAVLVRDENPHNNKGNWPHHLLLVAGIVAAGVLLLFSFRVERRKKRG